MAGSEIRDLPLINRDLDIYQGQKSSWRDEKWQNHTLKHMQTEGHIYDQKFVYRKWSIGRRGGYFIFPIIGVALRQERCL